MHIQMKTGDKTENANIYISIIFLFLHFLVKIINCIKNIRYIFIYTENKIYNVILLFFNSIILIIL